MLVTITLTEIETCPEQEIQTIKDWLLVWLHYFLRNFAGDLTSRLTASPSNYVKGNVSRYFYMYFFSSEN